MRCNVCGEDVEVPFQILENALNLGLNATRPVIIKIGCTTESKQLAFDLRPHVPRHKLETIL